MDRPFGRITMGHLIFVLYWTDTIKQAEVYDASKGPLEHINVVTPKKSGNTLHIFDLVDAVMDYGRAFNLTIDDIAI